VLDDPQELMKALAQSPWTISWK